MSVKHRMGMQFVQMEYTGNNCCTCICKSVYSRCLKIVTCVRRNTPDSRRQSGPIIVKQIVKCFLCFILWVFKTSLVGCFRIFSVGIRNLSRCIIHSPYNRNYKVCNYDNPSFYQSIHFLPLLKTFAKL